MTRTVYAMPCGKTHLGPVANPNAFPDLQECLDGLLQVPIHVVVIEDTGSATVSEHVCMSLPQVIPWKGPMVQS